MPLRGSAAIAPQPAAWKTAGRSATEGARPSNGSNFTMPVLTGPRSGDEASLGRLSRASSVFTDEGGGRPGRWLRRVCCRRLLGRSGSERGERGGRKKKKKKKRRWSPFRIYVNRVVKSSRFSNFILSAIFLNSVLITLQNVESTMLAAMYWFDVFDKILMGIYILELTLKLYAQQERFLDSGWNIFDAFIVSISVVETAMYTVLNDSSSLSPSIFRLFRVFKALRAMRALRAISFLQNLQLIISTLFRSIPAMGSIILLLMLLLYIFAIIFVTLYQDIFPERFSNLWTAMFSLFQLVTLDDWSKYYITIYEQDPAGAPQLMILMSLFIVLETFIVLNLMIAVIVNSLERANERKRQRKLRRQEQREAEAHGDKAPASKPALARGRKRKRKAKVSKAQARKRVAAKAEASSLQGSPRSGGGGGGRGGSGKRSPARQRRGSASSWAAADEGKRFAKGDDSPGSDDEGSGDEADMNRLKTPAPVFLNDNSIPYWQRELQPEVLALLASLDHNHHVLFEQQRLLDDLVDVTAPSARDEVRR